MITFMYRLKSIDGFAGQGWNLESIGRYVIILLWL